jgi:hypothetical protein
MFVGIDIMVLLVFMKTILLFINLGDMNSFIFGFICGFICAFKFIKFIVKRVVNFFK